MFFKIKLFFYDLFVYKIPYFWNWLKDEFKTNFWVSIGIAIMIPSVLLGVYEGFQYNRYQQAQILQKKQEKFIQRQNQVMNIHESGPEKFLQEQLSCKNQSQVIKMFNENEKWRGQYGTVIASCSNFTKNSQYQNYLNPIVNDILDGPTVKAIQTGLPFTNKPINWNGNSATNGIMLILLNPNNQNDVNAVKSLLQKHVPYDIKIYDDSAKDGSGMFNQCAFDYFNASNGKVKGFTQSEMWTGRAYAFNNNTMVWHSKELSNFPDKLPIKLS